MDAALVFLHETAGFLRLFFANLEILGADFSVGEI